MRDFRYFILFISLAPFLLLNNQCAKTKDVELIDADVATCFYHSELYYSALRESLQKDFVAFRQALSGTDYEAFLP